MAFDRCLDHNKTLTFIDHYKSFVELWDPNHKDYNNKKKRNSALECLAINHNMSIAEVKSKIKSLRSYFSKEHQKVMERIEEDFESSWFAYKPLLFILVTKEPKSKSTEESDPDCPDATAEEHSELLRRSLRRKSNLKRLREPETPPLIHTFPKIPPKSQKSELSTKDEFSIFGQMVATQIRKLSRRNQAIARNTIQNFLFDMEMREMATDENPAPSEIIVQSLIPSTPSQMLKNGESAYSEYTVSCKKIEDLVTLHK